MDIRGQDKSGRKPLSSASKRPDAFWGLIVPTARLEKGRLAPNTGAHLAYPPKEHAEELKGTQSVVYKEKETAHTITRGNATDLYPRLDVTPKDKKPVIRRDRGRTETTAEAQPALPYISLAEQLKRTQPVEGDEQAGNSEIFEGLVLAPTSALHKGDKNEESSEGPDDTIGSDGDEDYAEDDREYDSETASDAPSPVTQKPQSSCVTPRRASARARGNKGKWVKEPSEVTAPKRKKAPSQLGSTKGRRLRKRVKLMVEESNQKEVEEKTANRSVPQIVTRLAKARAQGQTLSILPALPPLSRQYQSWTKKEEETLFALRSRGENWKYIGERVLGRTASGVQGHWDLMRTESLKPVETRAKGLSQFRTSSVVSMMAKIPKKNKPWSKEEEGTLINLRARNKTLKYVCRRIPGKGYAACKEHWRRIKNRYAQAVIDIEDLE